MNILRNRFAAVVLGATVLLTALPSAAQPARPAPVDTDPSAVEYFLPASGAQYDPAILTPNAFFGFELGDRLADWGDVTRYMNYLAEASDRVSIKTFGRTHEGRTYLQAVITSPANQANLEPIRRAHLKVTDAAAAKGMDFGKLPLVVNLGASIHGNEISGCQATLALAYYYAAVQDPAVERMLSETVLVLSPGFNPDGINRFCSWINTNASRHPFEDNQAREYHEPAPSFRANHYWMDCNRDWLTAQFDVGQNCVAMYEYWMPNVLLDMHEMTRGRALFYFSPGDPNRTYQYIPQENQDLTLAISEFTGRSLDSIKVTFFTQRGYDDFFIGKGACYGDIQGSVCILHELVAPRGHLRFVPQHGHWTLAESIRWQGHAATAVLEGAVANAQALKDYRYRFYQDAAAAADADPSQGYLFDAGGDRALAWHFIDNLRLHEIDAYRVTDREGQYYVPFRQKHYYKIKGIFEDITQYTDSLFYDISTWSPARAYQLNVSLTATAPRALERIDAWPFPQGTVSGGPSPIGYAFASGDYYAPWLIQALQQRGIRVEVAQQPFAYRYRAGRVKTTFEAGTLVVPVGGQPVSEAELYALLCDLSGRSAVDVTALQADRRKGFDLASVSRTIVRSPRTAILTNTGNSIQQGAMWYLLDARYAMNHSLVDLEMFRKEEFDLTRYDVLICSGTLPEREKMPAAYDRLQKWVEEGGTLVLLGSARTVSDAIGGAHVAAHVANGVSGVVLNAEMTGESPLFWGYRKRNLDLFKGKATTWSVPEEAEVLMHWSEKPYRSGYISERNLKRIAGTPVIALARKGQGVTVFIQEDVTYRSYWFGGNHLLTNAIYFGDLL